MLPNTTTRSEGRWVFERGIVAFLREVLPRFYARRWMQTDLRNVDNTISGTGEILGFYGRRNC